MLRRLIIANFHRKLLQRGPLHSFTAPLQHPVIVTSAGAFCRLNCLNFVTSTSQNGSREVVEQIDNGTPASRRCDAISREAKDLSGTPWNGKVSVRWLAGASTIAVLLLVAAVPTKDDGATSAEMLVNVVSEAAVGLWESSARAVKGITSMLESSFNVLSGVPSKALQTAIAALVFVQSMKAILVCKGESATKELALRWRISVASLIADLAGASQSRRRALMDAGNGAVVDWLLEAIGHGDIEFRLIQAEAARAVAHFLSDDGTREDLLGRPNALFHLLLFAISIEPSIQTSGQRKPQLSLTEENLRGRSMLIAAIMDIVTSNCKIDEKSETGPKLSPSADVKDIAIALDVIKEGGLYLDEGQDDGEGSGKETGGAPSLGIRVLGSTSVAGLQNKQSLQSLLGLAGTFLLHWAGCMAASWTSDRYWQTFPSSAGFFEAKSSNLGEIAKPLENASSYGLWDDLQGRYIAVPLATWAVATWAQASSGNCKKIAELDRDGDALMVSVMAPERTVKWHGATAVRYLLESGHEEPAAVWSSALLRTAIQASNVDDGELALVTLNSFHLCIKQSADAQKVVSEKSLPFMRELAKRTRNDSSIQKVLAQALEVLSLNGGGLPLEEAKKWSSILLYWIFNQSSECITRSAAATVLGLVLDGLGQSGILLSQIWLAMLLTDSLRGAKVDSGKGDSSSGKTKAKGLVQTKTNQMASQAATELARVVWLTVGDEQDVTVSRMATNVSESPWGDLLTLDVFQNLTKAIKKDPKSKLTAADAAMAVVKAMKALTELSAEDHTRQSKIIEAGGLLLLRRCMLSDDYEQWHATEKSEALKVVAALNDNNLSSINQTGVGDVKLLDLKAPPTAHLQKHAARLLSVLALRSSASAVIKQDETWCRWLEECANGKILSCNDLKCLSYARATLLNVEVSKTKDGQLRPGLSNGEKQGLSGGELLAPHFEDKVFLLNTESPYWKQVPGWASSCKVCDGETSDTMFTDASSDVESLGLQQGSCNHGFNADVVFVHGLRGGPFKTWRIADDKSSTTGRAGFVEKIDIDSGREGTCWPKQWLASDLPACRLLTVKYKTNFSQWSGATLPLQEVSAVLLDKLIAAGVGNHPVIFVTHSMGGLVVKEMLMQAWQDKSRSHIVKNTSGIVFYSCPHFGSKLADVPWRFGLVLRPAPSIVELRSGSTRLEDLNQFIRTLHKGGLEVISFSETKVTPLVEGYGGWALRMEVVPIESAYPGFGELVVLDGTDHVNSCKPLGRDDPAYTQTLQFLQKLAKSFQRRGTQ